MQRKEKVVIIGANHAGTHSILEIANKYRETHEVVAYDKNDNISFLGCGMALWIGGVIESGEELFYATPEKLKELGVGIHMKHEFKNVNYEEKKLEIKDLETGEMKEETYDKLIFAMGSWPVLPPLKGSDLDNIMYAKIFQNAELAIEKIKDKEIKKVTVVGAGYIGLELAEAFKANGKEVTLINDMNVLNRYYDKKLQDMMKENLDKNGIDLRLGETVTEFDGVDGKVTKVITTEGEYEADLVLMCIGFKPNTELLKGTGIDLTDRGAIITNNNMETSVKDVYAVGDCTAIYNNASRRYEHIALATNAVRTGIVAGHNACGTPLQMQGVQGSNAIHIFGLTMCSTGLTELSAKELELDYDLVEVEALVKPAFMPDNDNVTLRVLWEKESKRIIGAQLASTYDITLALHFFSLAIQEGYTIDKLALTDTFFLPHFNQPHNFITKAGLMALNKF